MQAVSGNGMYTHSVVSKLHKCCFECVTGRSEKGLWNRGHVNSVWKDGSAIRQSTFKENQKQMHLAGNLSADQGVCEHLVNLFSILLNSPFQYTYLGQSAA